MEYDRDPKIHPFVFKGTELPFHTDDKPFGMTQNDWEAMRPEFHGSVPEPQLLFGPAPPSLPSTVCLVDTGRCYWCQNPAVYGFRGKLYCPTCWEAEND